MMIKGRTADSFLLYLNESEIKDLDFENKAKMKAYIETVFLKLKATNYFKSGGYYQVTIFINKSFGLIMEVIKLKNKMSEVELKIIIETNALFLYEIEDYFLINSIKLETINIFYYKQKYYLLLKEELTSFQYNFLSEHSRLVFGKEALKIRKRAFQL